MDIVQNSLNKNSSIGFKAKIISNHPQIFDALKKATSFKEKDYKSISKVLEKVDSFSKMKEDSIVEVHPNAVNGQVYLVTDVFDKAKKFFIPVTQRMSRMISRDEKYSDKYLTSTKNLIKNVDKINNGLSKLAETINKSKTIKNIKIGERVYPKNEESVNKMLYSFCYTDFYNNDLNKGFNPQKQLTKIFKALDKTPEDKTIGIIREKNNQKEYFSVKSGEIERKVLFSDLFKIPAEVRLTK